MNHPSSWKPHLRGAAMVLTVALAGSVSAQTKFSDVSPLSAKTVPGNLALALSVEFPTAVSNTHLDTQYNKANTYIGYFDPNKCYTYVYNSDETMRYFQPAGVAGANHTCSGKWSGNFMNWASMQTIDPFRWALTGGYRVKDTPTETYIEKANATGQGGTGNFPDRSITADIGTATPLNWSSMKLRIQGLGNRLFFTSTGDNNASNTGTPYGSSGTINAKTVYEVSVRVKVCDSSTSAGSLESNCVKYSQGYKPEGLIQRYADKIRFSAFGYLNDAGNTRDGGVLRARMKYVGPMKNEPGKDPAVNAASEWDATTGVMIRNPDTADAAAMATYYGIAISDSGVMNYVNKFGQIIKGSYKSNDPVGELYYAALRYYRNLGNVPEYTSPGTATVATRTTYADGFPVITNWDDPIVASCQKNFILGIGDVNTHADRNLPGATGKSEGAKPAAVTADTTMNALDWTNKVGDLQGIANLGAQQPYNGCCSNNGALMAGMAYYANTQDIRTDLEGQQSVKTYWLDVQEYQKFVPNNQFYLATKYGGFSVPATYNASTATAKMFTDNQTWWHTGPATDLVGAQLRPDNYYTASKADLMVQGLTTAMASIAASLEAPSSSLQTASPLVGKGTASYGAAYEQKNWTGNVWASKVLGFVKDSGEVVYSPVIWNFQDRLYDQIGTDPSKRRVVTYRPDTKRGTNFLWDSLTSTQQAALNPTWTSADDGKLYLNWVRGDRSEEQNAVSSTSSRAFRVRQDNRLVADIGDSGVVVLGPPATGDQGLSNAANPGYNAYATTYATRRNILIAAANNGMVHVIDGSLDVGSGATGGYELFAFIPNAAFAGPNNTPSVDGLASVGNPDFVHKYLVNGKIAVGDVDFQRTNGSSSSSNDWHSIAVGTLGKGGRSVYALDLTTADTVTTEAQAANRVMWEFTDSQMGLTFGKPVITKLAKWGWVVVVGSGMNTSDGKGAFYILNARTGALLEKVALPQNGVYGENGTTAAPTGLAYIEPWYPDRRDMTAEALYAGDLHGNLWRLDVTPIAGSYPTPVKIAKLTDGSGNELPVTTRAMPVVDSTGKRYVLVGTGKLFSADDVRSSTNNRIFAIRDGSNNSFFKAADLPATITWPITQDGGRQDLQDFALKTALAKNKAGFYLDITKLLSNVPGYRVTIDPATNSGTDDAAFAFMRPDSASDSNAGCSGTSDTFVYAIDFQTGSAIKNDWVAWPIQDLRYVTKAITKDSLYPPGGGTPIDGGTGTGGTGGGSNNADYVTGLAKSGNTSKAGGGTTGDKVDGESGSDPAGGKRLINWREIPLRN